MNKIEAFEAWLSEEIQECENSGLDFRKRQLVDNKAFFQEGFEVATALAHVNVNEQSQAQQPIEHIEYRHKNGNVWFHQSVKDELPSWAYDVRPYTSQAQQVSQWISVEERLPETKEMIISARKRADGTWGLDLNYWTVSNRFAYKYTHWMPLPPAPVSANEQPEGE